MRPEEVRAKNVFSIGSLLVSLLGTLLRSLLRSLLVQGSKPQFAGIYPWYLRDRNPAPLGIDTPGIETHDSLESKPHHQGSTPWPLWDRNHVTRDRTTASVGFDTPGTRRDRNPSSSGSKPRPVGTTTFDTLRAIIWITG